MKKPECTNERHAYGGTGRWLHEGQCVACIFKENEDLKAKVKEIELDRFELGQVADSLRRDLDDARRTLTYYERRCDDLESYNDHLRFAIPGGHCTCPPKDTKFCCHMDGLLEELRLERKRRTNAELALKRCRSDG